MNPHGFLTVREEMLYLLKVKVERQFSAEVWAMRSMKMHVGYELDKMVAELRTTVLAEKLPPQHVRHVSMEPRHASWWDHLKATYRGRWWWPAALGHVSYVDVPVVTYLHIRDHWAYPKASLIPPENGLGRPVVVSFWKVDEDGA